MQATNSLAEMKAQACSTADKASGVRNVPNPPASAQEWRDIAAADLDVEATADVHLCTKDAESSSMLLLLLSLPGGLVPPWGCGADARFPSTTQGSPAAFCLTASRAGVREGCFIIHADSCSCTAPNAGEKDCPCSSQGIHHLPHQIRFCSVTSAPL